jgi:hypothetical protein
METLTTISVEKQTKKELEKLKICDDESYNSLLKRILPSWAVILKNKLKEEKELLPSPQSQHARADSDL